MGGYLSLVTPLKGFLSLLTSMSSPESLSRFIQRLMTGLKTCVRFLTAPFLCPSPLGGFVAICNFLSCCGWDFNFVQRSSVSGTLHVMV